MADITIGGMTPANRNLTVTDKLEIESASTVGFYVTGQEILNLINGSGQIGLSQVTGLIAALAAKLGSTNNLSDLDDPDLALKNIRMFPDYLSVDLTNDVTLTNPLQSWIEVTTAGVGKRLVLPVMNDTSQAGAGSLLPGRSIVYINRTSNSFQIAATDTATIIATLNANCATILTLLDNSTANGSFRALNIAQTGNNLSDLSNTASALMNIRLSPAYSNTDLTNDVTLTNPLPTWIDVATAGIAKKLILPAMNNASQTGTGSIRAGSFFLITNTTSNSFIVYAQDTTTVVAPITANSVNLLTVTSNSTANGTFKLVTLLQSSNINAAMGVAGLDTSSRLYNILMPYFPIIDKSTNFIVTSSDNRSIFHVTAQVTIGAAAITAQTLGYYFTIFNQSLDVVTFDPTDTINGASTFSIMPYQCYTFAATEFSAGVYDWKAVSAYWHVGMNRVIYPVQSNITVEAYHYNGILKFDSTSALTVTVPQTSTEVLPEGFTLDVYNANTADGTIAKEGSDTLTGNTLVAPGAWGTVVKSAAGSPNTWNIAGCTSVISGTFGGPVSSTANGTFNLQLSIPFACTITNITTVSEGGLTLTATFQKRSSGGVTTVFSGTANAVSSTRQTQAQNQAISNGDDLQVITTSTNSTGTRWIWSVEYTRRM